MRLTYKRMMALPRETRRRAWRDGSAVVDGKTLHVNKDQIGKAIGLKHGYLGFEGGWIYKEREGGVWHPVCHGWRNWRRIYSDVIMKHLFPEQEESHCDCRSLSCTLCNG